MVARRPPSLSRSCTLGPGVGRGSPASKHTARAHAISERGVCALSAVSLFASLALQPGCSSVGTEDAGVVAPSGVGSLALVRVERQAEALESPARITSSIKVARYRGLDGERLLRLLGAEGRELDACAAIGGLDEAPLPSSAQVELLSVGSIALRLGTREAQPHVLSPRLFPALATTAGGFFYADAFDGEAGDGPEVVVSAAGRDGVGRFELALTMPEQVSGLELDTLAQDGPIALTRDRALELAWEPGAQGGYLELELYAGGSVLTCTLRDDGHFSLPRERLEAMDADDNAVLVLRRVHVAPVAVQGVESAYAHLSSARTSAIQLR
jgi:hypothetical protein